jgi:hypothetical protein
MARGPAGGNAISPAVPATLLAPQPGLDATSRNRCPLVMTGQALASSYRARSRSRYFSRLYPGIDQLTAFR